MTRFTASFPPYYSIVSPLLQHRFPPLFGHFRIVSPLFSKRYKRLKSLYKQGNAGIENRLIPFNRIKRSISPAGMKQKATFTTLSKIYFGKERTVK